MQNPYNYSFDKALGVYQFTTKNKIIYSVAFIVDYTLSTVSTLNFEFDNIYQIIIEKVSDVLEPFDAQVFLTMDLIISDFFNNVENALIYICSNDNGKEIQRFRVFNRWHQKSTHNKYIEKVDKVIKFNETNTIVYTSLLYHINNPNSKYILDAFTEIEDALNSEK